MGYYECIKTVVSSHLLSLPSRQPKALGQLPQLKAQPPKGDGANLTLQVIYLDLLEDCSGVNALQKAAKFPVDAAKKADPITRVLPIATAAQVEFITNSRPRDGG